MFKLRALQKFKQLVSTPLEAPPAPTFSAAGAGDPRCAAPMSPEPGRRGSPGQRGLAPSAGRAAERQAFLPSAVPELIRPVTNALILALQEVLPSVGPGKTHVAISESDR